MQPCGETQLTVTFQHFKKIGAIKLPCHEMMQYLYIFYCYYMGYFSSSKNSAREAEVKPCQVLSTSFTHVESSSSQQYPNTECPYIQVQIPIHVLSKAATSKRTVFGKHFWKLSMFERYLLCIRHKHDHRLKRNGISANLLVLCLEKLTQIPWISWSWSLKKKYCQHS